MKRTLSLLLVLCLLLGMVTAAFAEEAEPAPRGGRSRRRGG